MFIVYKSIIIEYTFNFDEPILYGLMLNEIMILLGSFVGML